MFLAYSGPAIRAAAATSRGQMREGLSRYNRAVDGSAVIENTYLQTVAVLA
jgi:hypothetical protein